MTQEEFADYMGVTRQSVSKWELNKTFPDVEKVIRISELYDVSIDYILKGENPDKNAVAVNIDLDQKENTCFNLSHDLSGEAKEASCPKEDFHTNKKSKRIGIMISAIITGMLTLWMLFVFIFCLTQQVFKVEAGTKIGVRVEKVHQQLSLVELSGYNEEGDYISETMLIDNKGVRQGDYIYAYVDGENMSTDYRISMVLIGLISLILFTVMLVLQIKELINHE